MNTQVNKNIFSYILISLGKALIMFFYIYEINLSVFGLPMFFTTRRILVFFLFFFTIFTKGLKQTFSLNGFGKYTKSFSIIIFYELFVLIYSFLLLLIVGRGDGTHIYEITIRVLLFGFLPIFLFKELFRNIADFLEAILLATIIQSCFIVICLLTPEIGMALDLTFSLDPEKATHFRSGYAGGLNCITAQGCLLFSMGLVAATYFCAKYQSFIFYSLYILLAVLDTMIARTGLVISVIGLFLLISNSFKGGALKSIKFIVIFTIIGSIIFMFVNNGAFDDLFNFKRLTNLFENGAKSEFFDGYFYGGDTKVPAISFDTLIGIGITSGTSASGIEINVDGGFARTYASLGIIVAFFYYLTLFSQLYKIIKITKNQILKTTITFFIAIIIIGEFKEFTLFQQYMYCIFFTLLALNKKSYSSISSMTTSFKINHEVSVNN